MFSKQELEILLKETKAKVATDGWTAMPILIDPHGFEVFPTIIVRSGRTVGGRYADLVAVNCDHGDVRFREDAIQVEVGAGFFPVETDDDRMKEKYGYTPYVRFVERLYPF